MKCTYRIFPAWRGFGGENPENVTWGMARHAAEGMGRQVIAVEKLGHGFDQRFGGYFIDYTVTYSSTGVLDERTRQI